MENTGCISFLISSSRKGNIILPCLTKKEQRKEKGGREIRIPATILLETWEENHC